MTPSAVHTPLILMLALFLLTGCAPGKIDKIIRDPRAGTTATVILLRQGVTAPAPEATELKQGDIIETPDGVTAVVWLQGNSRLLLAPNTRIELVNPNHIIRLLTSAGKAIGRIFVHAKDSLKIDGEYVSAATNGTEFQVTRGQNNTFTVSVLSGKVIMTSNTGGFAPVHLSRMETASFVPGSTPSKTRLSSTQANEIMQWANEVEAGTGRRNQSLLVPDVTGLPLAAAQSRLRQAHFSSKEIASIDGSGPMGTVLSQEPAAGSPIAASQAVQLAYKAEERQVPDLVGLLENEAVGRLGMMELRPGAINRKLTGRSTAGRVVGQHPPANQRVAIHAAVNLDIEAESVQIPQLTGMTLQQAKALISQQGLAVAAETEGNTGRYNAGTVIGQSPSPMTRVVPGTRMTLTVEAESVIVPSLTDMPHQRATQLLRNAGLSGSVTTAERANMAPDTVLSQSPDAGTRVPRGSRVNITVSKTPTERTTEVDRSTVGRRTGIVPIPVVIVPNVINLPYSQAAERLANAGLSRGSVTTVERADLPADTVFSQNPGARQQVQRGGTVDLTVSKLPKMQIIHTNPELLPLQTESIHPPTNWVE